MEASQWVFIFSPRAEQQHLHLLSDYETKYSILISRHTSPVVLQEKQPWPLMKPREPQAVTHTLFQAMARAYMLVFFILTISSWTILWRGVLQSLFYQWNTSVCSLCRPRKAELKIVIRDHNGRGITQVRASNSSLCFERNYSHKDEGNREYG